MSHLAALLIALQILPSAAASTFCDAGSSHWAGTVEIGSKSRDMFFMYFESRSVPAMDPLIFWLNGVRGPGASSMTGVFYEIGPCLVNSEGNATTKNPLSWTNFANLVFIDQPMGVGFSRPDEPALWANNLAEATVDFDKFLDGFFELFPGLDDAERDIHMAGESFAGHYIPHFTSRTRRNFSSIVLVDPYIDLAESALGIYDHCCVGENPHPGLNKTACKAVEKRLDVCKTQGDVCRSTYDVSLCEKAEDSCFWAIMEWFDNGPEGHPTHNPFDDRLICDNPERLGMCGGMGTEEVTRFLNQTAVKQALGQPNVSFSEINYAFNAIWTGQPEMNLPSTREISHLLDIKNTPIIVLNGNNDIIGNTEGMIKILDSLPWGSHDEYEKQSLSPWWYEDSRGHQRRGGEFKQFEKLAVVTVDEAGHMNMADQRRGTSAIIKRWLSKASLGRNEKKGSSGRSGSE
ncbi:hypothetical protein CkaCkLH20_11905 [Colletotrichum karsti]|uniref:Carboxypeptidase Y-like protein A n=1 Tax=Colletotrichum karsti TaxID=1095194 RepID=A0A9P6LD28_9PEZI|nr:uncharacterized protein CkaCkLH20_11905 [Colletotrichum karsti]KAF9870599.1 hypothetical protein CkaCkLH20_11905 [Colletotrichum karsti]